MNINKHIPFLILIMLSVVLMSFVVPEKKVEKLASKIWKDKEITLATVKLPDTLKAVFKYFGSINSGTTLVGYACYTSAFGCRIGGCAAPGNPNSESYETFDYIVIYDTNLSILKVDIANYPGEYGYEICRSKWLQQFEGKTDGFELNNNVDGISGATVSVSYLINDLNSVGAKVKTLREKEYF